MIIKPKKKRENAERYWIFFLLMLSFSIIVIYFSLNNPFLTIRPFIPFGHKIILFIFDTKFYLILITLFFNFGNIYQPLILFYTLVIPQYIYYILICLKLHFYQNTFYQYFLFSLYFFVIGHILLKKDKKTLNKILTIFYVVIYLFLLFFSSNYLAIENNSYILGNKIISGLFLSFSCYYFIFYVLNVNHTNGLQLFNFIDKINNNIIFVLLFILIILSIYIKANDKSLTNTLFLFCLIIPICGIKYEIKITFNSNKRNWKDYNFASEEENNNNNININNLLSKIKITKPIKWNKTSIFYDLLRLVFLIFFLLLISFFADKFDDENLKIAFLFFSFSIILFVLSKILMYWMELINMTFFFLESDSLNE